MQPRRRRPVESTEPSSFTLRFEHSHALLRIVLSAAAVRRRINDAINATGFTMEKGGESIGLGVIHNLSGAGGSDKIGVFLGADPNDSMIGVHCSGELHRRQSAPCFSFRILRHFLPFPMSVEVAAFFSLYFC